MERVTKAIAGMDVRARLLLGLGVALLATGAWIAAGGACPGCPLVTHRVLHGAVALGAFLAGGLGVWSSLRQPVSEWAMVASLAVSVAAVGLAYYLLDIGFWCWLSLVAVTLAVVVFAVASLTKPLLLGTGGALLALVAVSLALLPRVQATVGLDYETRRWFLPPAQVQPIAAGIPQPGDGVVQGMILPRRVLAVVWPPPKPDEALRTSNMLQELWKVRPEFRIWVPLSAEHEIPRAFGGRVQDLMPDILPGVKYSDDKSPYWLYVENGVVLASGWLLDFTPSAVEGLPRAMSLAEQQASDEWRTGVSLAPPAMAPR